MIASCVFTDSVPLEWVTCTPEDFATAYDERIVDAIDPSSGDEVATSPSPEGLRRRKPGASCLSWQGQEPLRPQLEPPIPNQTKVKWHFMKDAYLSVEQVAAYLGVSKDTVYTWISAKKMPAHRLGRLWKFQKDEVDTWVKSGGAAAHRETDSTKKQDQ